MDPIQTNKMFIDRAVNSKEFTDKIAEAAPFRVKIDTDYRREMKEIKDLYLKEVVKGDKKLTDIMNKNRKARSEEEVAYMKAAFKKAGREFQAVKKIIHPNKGDSTEAAKKLVERIVEVAKVLKYIGRNELEDAFVDAGIKVSMPTLESESKYFATDSAKEVMADIFEQADEVQGQICRASDQIKITIFDELPEHIRFDPKKNRNGIKKGAFQKIVKSKAVAIEHSTDKANKFKEYLIKGAESAIISKQIEAEKTKAI